MKNLAKPIAYFYDVLEPVHLRGNQGRVLKGSTLLNWLKPLYFRGNQVYDAFPLWQRNYQFHWNGKVTILLPFLCRFISQSSSKMKKKEKKKKKKKKTTKGCWRGDGVEIQYHTCFNNNYILMWRCTNIRVHMYSPPHQVLLSKGDWLDLTIWSSPWCTWDVLSRSSHTTIAILLQLPRVGLSKPNNCTLPIWYNLYWRCISVIHVHIHCRTTA